MIPPQAPLAIQTILLPVAKVAQVGIYIATFRIRHRSALALAVLQVLYQHQLDRYGHLKAAVTEELLHLVHDGQHQLVQLDQPIAEAVEFVIESLVDEDGRLDGLDQPVAGRELVVAADVRRLAALDLGAHSGPLERVEGPPRVVDHSGGGLRGGELILGPSPLRLGLEAAPWPGRKLRGRPPSSL